MDVVPQLDFSLYPSQVFWFFVAFLLLYSVVRGVVLPKVREVACGRIAILDESVEAASRIYEEVQTELLRQETALESAEKTTQQVLERVREELETMQKCMFSMLDAELEELLRDTEENLERMAEEERENLIDLASEVARTYCGAVCEAKKVEKNKLKGLVSKVYGGR